ARGRACAGASRRDGRRRRGARRRSWARGPRVAPRARRGARAGARPAPWPSSPRPRRAPAPRAHAPAPRRASGPSVRGGARPRHSWLGADADEGAEQARARAGEARVDVQRLELGRVARFEARSAEAEEPVEGDVGLGVGPIERVDRAVEEREREGLAEGFEAGRAAIAPELGERRMRREGRAARALAERGAEVPVLPRRTRDEGGA